MDKPISDKLLRYFIQWWFLYTLLFIPPLTVLAAENRVLSCSMQFDGLHVKNKTKQSDYKNSC